ncbi:hypothetical protein [Nevskia ramosa]|uniref:hypothetical protein n=1 Tax=Nevskia ramosa TaxID=64002 RepID=UPI003D126FF1
MKPARPLQVWATVVVNKRSEWIVWSSVRRTRSESWQAAKNYLYDPKYFALADKRRKAGEYRLSRITVALEPTK